ncbi:hypothetical protein NCS56_01508600 [Fusarium sp. Ph1]|nr:hypothetical protein NCS56_01508600 [Fusarium sp. Ph1]
MRLFYRASWLTLFSVLVAGDKDSCAVICQHLTDLPHGNFFFSDCNIDAVFDYHMKATEAFEKDPSIKNLIQLKDNEGTGRWRDSPSGLGNARIPFDVNCVLVPAALYAISELARMPDVYPNNAETEAWKAAAAKRAKVWEDKTPPLFQYNITSEKATSLLEDYTRKDNFYNGPTHADSLHKYSSARKVVNYAIAIKTLFLLDSEDDEQLTTFINATANAIL